MIPSVHARGRDVAGLLRYLFGPGRREEHDRPRLVVAWTGTPDLRNGHAVGVRSDAREPSTVGEPAPVPARVPAAAAALRTVKYGSCSVKSLDSDACIVELARSAVEVDPKAGRPLPRSSSATEVS